MKELFTAIVMAFVVLAFPHLARAEPEYHPMPGREAADLPFSEAVRVGDLLFLSGMIGLKPGTMELAEGGIQA